MVDDDDDDDNPFVGGTDPKQGERRALLHNAVRDEGGKSSRKKLVSVGLFVAVLIIGTLSLLSTKWKHRVSDGSGSSASVSSWSDDDCTSDYTFYKQSSTYCNEASAPVLEGADCVAYFSSSANYSTPGSSDYTSTHRGYSFYFASEKNRDLFDKTPDYYAPAYGGFCAFGLSGQDPRNTISSLSQVGSMRQCVPGNPSPRERNRETEERKKKTPPSSMHRL